MISLVRFSEVRRMEGQKRQRGNNPLNFVPEVENEEDIDAGKRRRSSLGIRSEILKDEAGIVPVSGGGASAAQNHNSSYGYGEEDEDCEHAKSFKSQFQDADNHGGGSISGFGNMLGPGDYRRLISNNSQWNSESLSEYSEKYKRGISSSAGAAAAPGGAGTTEEEERRVRSRPDQASSVVLTNLLGRSREETDLHMNISARTLRPSGGKDRHSKVFTAKGPRDRRVRLSVSTAIQFYDVQDRLGYDQPSKAVEWLMKKAKNAIDELSQIPLPGIDSLVPTSSSSMYHHHHHHHPYGGYSMPSHDQMNSHDQVYNPCTSSYSSTSDLQQQQLKGVTQACSATELENPSHHQSSGTEMKAAGGRSEVQAVDESDGFTNRHAITGLSSSGTRRGELATEITMSVGGDAPPRSNQVQAAAAHHHPGVGAAAGLSSFSSPPLASIMNTSMMNTSHHHRQGPLQLQQQQHPPPRTASYLYEDALGSPAGGGQRIFHHYNHHHHQQQQQQASLVPHHQTYLQQNQEFLQSPSSAGSSVLPFSMVSTPQAKPYLDQFHSLKIAAAGGSGAEKVTGISSSPGLSSPRFGLGGSFLGSGSPGVYSPQNSNSKQQQQEHIVGGFAAENSQLIQSFEEQLRGGNTKRD